MICRCSKCGKRIPNDRIIVCDDCIKKALAKPFKSKINDVIKVTLNPGESVEIKSTGQYGQTMIADVMDDGIIAYRNKH